MTAYLTPKIIVIRVLASFAAALAVLYGLVSLKTSSVPYDALMALRPPRSVDRRLLLIDTAGAGGAVESAQALSVVEALIEMDADTLIIQTPLLGSPARDAASGPETPALFDREFSLITGNIHALFEGIMTGSIPPEEAAWYVEEAARLTEAGKERLLGSAVKSGGAAGVQMEKAKAALGKVFIEERLMMPLARPDGAEGGWAGGGAGAEFRPPELSGGLTRRVFPGLPPASAGRPGGLAGLPGEAGGVAGGLTSGIAAEHIVLRALKSRFAQVEFITTGRGKALALLPLEAAPPDGGGSADGAAADTADAVNGPRSPEGVDGGGAADGPRLPDGGGGGGAADAANGPRSPGGGGAANGPRSPDGGGAAVDTADAVNGPRSPDGVAADARDPRVLISLDADGALLFDYPAALRGFRGIPLTLFTGYAEADRTLYRLLAGALSLSTYGRIEPARYPPFVYERNAGLYAAMLDAPDAESKERWRAGRAAWFAACADFFDARTERAIEASFAALIEGEALSAEGAARLYAMRDAELEKFYIARDVYRGLSRDRAALDEYASGAICVLGPGGAARFSDAELSILLADALLSGKAITAIDRRYVLFCGALAALAAVLLLCALPVLPALAFCAVLPALAFAVCAGLFVFRACWVDPFVPACAIAAGAFVSAFTACAARFEARRGLTAALGASIPAVYLKALARSGERSADARAECALVAVRLPDYTLFETRERADSSAALLDAFRAEAGALFFAAGAVLAGCETDTLVFAFGAPPERLCRARGKGRKKLPHPALRAASFIRSIRFSALKTAPWYMGLDAGECVFRQSGASGYHASGPAAARARLLSALAAERNAPILVSKAAAVWLNGALLRPVRGTDSAVELYFELASGGGASGGL